jgi:hypothetical protein
MIITATLEDKFLAVLADCDLEESIRRTRVCLTHEADRLRLGLQSYCPHYHKFLIDTLDALTAPAKEAA